MREMNEKKVAVGSLAVCSMMLLNACAWMGGGSMGAAIGHMVFGAILALAGVFGVSKLKK